MGVNRNLHLLMACFLAFSCIAIVPASLASGSMEPSQSGDAPWAIGEGWEIKWYINTYNLSNTTLLDNRHVLLTVTGIESSGVGSELAWELDGDLQLNPGLLTEWEYVVIEELFYPI